MCKLFLSREGPTCWAGQSGEGGGNHTKVGKKCGMSPSAAAGASLPPALPPGRVLRAPAPSSASSPAPSGGAHLPR